MANNYIIYQMFLRTATRQGTLFAAENLLSHVRNSGANVVYLCPIIKADNDTRKNFWSKRQCESNLNNPNNPYRIMDYFKIDSEYGSEKDLKNFVHTAHKYDLKIILDLVYYHCGPNAEMILKNKNFIKHLSDGSPDCGEWNFPKLNYDCPELCEYMWGNMEYFIREFDVDGYRCDVGDLVPLDFWRIGKERIKSLKPNIIMINEGSNAEYIKSGVFDMNYFLWGGNTALEQLRDHFSETVGSFDMRNKQIICFENHDSVNDAYENRLDKKYSFNLCNALLTVIFTCGCVPFIYNGNEIADFSRHSIYGNRYHGKDLYIDWLLSVTSKGEKRMTLLKQLSDIYCNIPAITCGDLDILYDNNGILAYKRTLNNESLIVAANLTEKTVNLNLKSEISAESEQLLSSGIINDNENIIMSGGGFFIMLQNN